MQTRLDLLPSQNCPGSKEGQPHACKMPVPILRILELVNVTMTMQVWNRVLAPMSGQQGSEAIAEGSVGILKQALQVSADNSRQAVALLSRCT